MIRGKVMSISQGCREDRARLASSRRTAPNRRSLNTGDGLFVLLGTIPVLRPLSPSVCDSPHQHRGPSSSRARLEARYVRRGSTPVPESAVDDSQWTAGRGPAAANPTDTLHLRIDLRRTLVLRSRRSWSAAAVIVRRSPMAALHCDAAVSIGVGHRCL